MDKFIAECNTIWTEEHHQEVVRTLRDGKTGSKRDSATYRILKKFNLVSLGGVDKVADLKTGRYMATKQVAALVITNAHEETGHGGEKATLKQIKDQYHNIPMTAVKEYISRCVRCCEKKRRNDTRPGMVFKPIMVKDFNDRAQIDLVNFQACPDGSNQYILHYVEYLTKYHILRPLKSKCAKEVAIELL